MVVQLGHAMSKMIKSLNDIEPVKVYLNRVGAEARSLRTAVVRIDHGRYFTEKAVIKFERESGIVSCDHEEQGEESRAALATGVMARSVAFRFCGGRSAPGRLPGPRRRCTS
jgi:hypothetical protein